MKHLAVLLYVGLICFGVYFFISPSIIMLLAAIFGAYMAMNIGANDVANNVGPAVGAKAMTLGAAVVMAAVFEALGAIIAGGEVAKTIKDGIIDIAGFSDPNLFIYAMLSALLSAAIWLNIATYLKAPVSTTHSIVAGIMGAGIAALGFEVVDWGTMKNIVLSWFVSPVFGGVVAAIFLYFVKTLIVFKDDKIESAKTWVPVFVGIMSWAFGTYIALKGVKNVGKRNKLCADDGNQNLTREPTRVRFSRNIS